ncbi:MAG: AraC family transcriptional regulator [Pseudomonadota bacterium]
MDMMTLNTAPDAFAAPQGALAHGRFDTNDVASGDRLEAARAYLYGSCDVAPLGEGGDPIWMASQSWAFDGLVAMRNSWGPHRQQHLGNLDQDRLKLRLIRRGTFHRVSDGDVQTMGPDAVHIASVSSGYSDGPLERCCVSVPFKRVGYDPSIVPSVVSVPTSTPLGAVMQATMLSVFDQLPTCQKPDAGGLAELLTGLVRSALHGQKAQERSQHALVRSRQIAIRDFLRDNVHDPDLGLDAVCQRFACSRSVVYRAMEAEGGVQAFVREERMKLAYSLLSRGEPSRGAVSNVAYRCGFRDAGHFSRVFRSTHGVTPGAVLSPGCEV